MFRSMRVMRRGHIEIGVAPAGTEFSGQKTDKGEAQPLGEAEGLQELLFGVLKRGRDGIHGGNRQRTNLRLIDCSVNEKYSEGGERATAMKQRGLRVTGLRLTLAYDERTDRGVSGWRLLPV